MPSYSETSIVRTPPSALSIVAPTPAPADAPAAPAVDDDALSLGAAALADRAMAVYNDPVSNLFQVSSVGLGRVWSRAVGWGGSGRGVHPPLARLQ